MGKSVHSKCEPVAPAFASRVRGSEPELFTVVYSAGRHKITIKVRESDRISSIVDNISRIYALK